MVSMKEKIKDVFLEILETTSIEKIKVTDITKICSISRQTFYYYYYNIFAILKYILETETEKALENLNILDDFKESYIRIMKWFKNHKNIINNAYNYDNGRFLKTCLKKIIYPNIKNMTEKYSYGYTISEKQKDFISNFYFITFISFLFDWVERGYEGDPKILVENIDLILEGNFNRTIRNFENYNEQKIWDL